jgi:predicted secreted protein
MPKTRALGTTVTFGGVAVGALTSVGEVKPESEELDATTLDSSGGYRESLQGFKNSGECPLTGYLVKADLGQIALRAGYASGTPAATVVTFPDATTVSFTAYVKSYAVGGADVDGIVGFSAALRITGAVVVA